MKSLLLAVALVAGPAVAAPPTTCGLPSDYARALCAYQQRDFPAAERLFRSVAEKGDPVPETLKAAYFLARTLMKTGRYGDAADQLIRIYETDPAFYGSWNCDFLLGECRRALGKD